MTKTRRGGTSLRLRIALAIGVFWVAFILLLGGGGTWRMRAEYLRLEEQETIKETCRAVNAAHVALDAASTTARDWATWDDAWHFVETLDSGFVRSNLQETVLANINEDFMAFHRARDGRIVAMIARVETGPTPFPAEIMANLESGALLARPAITGEPVAGFLLLEDGPVMLASYPILRSDRQGPIRGALVLGRRLDRNFLQTLEKTTLYDLDMAFGKVEFPASGNVLLDAGYNGEPIHLHRLDADQLMTRIEIPDLRGGTAFHLVLTAPRVHYQIGMINIRRFLLGLALAGLAFGLLFHLLLDRLVLARLLKLGEAVGRIASGSGLNAVPEEGNDELTDLASRFNRLLSALDFNIAIANENAAHFRAVATSAQDAIVVMDNEGRATFWNPAAERIFGYTAEEMLGRPIHETLASPDFLEQILAAFPRWRATGEGAAIGRIVEVRARRKSGEEFPLELSLSSIRLGGVMNAVAILRDITERKRAEARLGEAKKIESIGLLAGGVAHEFNNQLAIVNASLAELEGDDPSGRRRGRTAARRRSGPRTRRIPRDPGRERRGGAREIRGGGGADRSAPDRCGDAGDERLRAGRSADRDAAGSAGALSLRSRRTARPDRGAADAGDLPGQALRDRDADREDRGASRPGGRTMMTRQCGRQRRR